MPKHVDPIKLNDSDVIRLTGLASGTIPAGEDVKRRAAAVLELSKGVQIKDVARGLGMRENSVTDIRRRFLSKGMAGLETAAKSGRPLTGLSADEVETRLDAFIDSFKQENNRNPTTLEAAKGLNASLSVVREAMKRRNMIQDRKRTWEIILPGDTAPHSIDLVGIFLSGEQQILAVKVTAGNDGSHVATQNAVITENRNFASSYTPQEGTAHYEQLADIIETFTDSQSKSRKKGFTGVEFVRELIKANGECSTPSYHLLVHGLPVVETNGTMISDTVVSSCEELSDWLLKTGNILDVLCTDAGSVSNSVRIVSSIESFLRVASSDSDPFVWMKTPTESDNCEQKASVNNHSSVPAQNEKTPAPGTVIAEVKIMGDDGQWITYETTLETGYRQQDLNPDSIDTYLKGVNVVEQAIAKTTREAARGINERYLNETVKKKRN